ncbi:MAG: ECF transporter S component [Desulfobacterales bacterium]|nr:ECF transporter S component [Desulfobacterales bacterium]
MLPNSETKLLIKVGIIAAFATLAFIGTLIIRIPIPATGGYFNLGDTFVMVAALLYGPLVGALVGMIGPAAADAVGFPQFILATAVVKFCEGGIVGLVGGTGKRGDTKKVVALMLGIAVLVGGYYLFEAIIYPFLARIIPFFAVTDPKAAIAELFPNMLQGTISAVIAFGICRVFRKKG